MGVISNGCTISLRQTLRKIRELEKTTIGNIFRRDYIANRTKYIDLLNRFGNFKKSFRDIPLDQDANNITLPHWNNIWISPLDGISIYSMLAINNPRYYIECGSGNSTKFAAHAIKENGLRTKIISIDPYPRAEIDQICDEIHRTPLEKMDSTFFNSISSEDIFVVDSSHRAFTNSDVTVFFLEILPRLPKNLYYALHDICLPYDYWAQWVVKEERHYNEQYMLAAYIIGGAMGDTLEIPLLYLAKQAECQQIIDDLIPHKSLWKEGGFLWMKRGNSLT